LIRQAEGGATIFYMTSKIYEEKIFVIFLWSAIEFFTFMFTFVIVPSTIHKSFGFCVWSLHICSYFDY
jgi:hypothetical protein